MTVLEPVRAYLAARRAEGKRRVRLAEVVEATGLPRRPVLRVLDKLTREGYLREVADDPEPPRRGECGPPRRNPTWRIVGDVTARPGPKPHRDTLRDKMYRIIRARRRFTRTDLMVLTGASQGSAEIYTVILERHGIIRRIGKRGGEIVWMLVKDPGPNRPRLDEGVRNG